VGPDAGHSRIQIVLNWGSRNDQVKDADSHLLCACKQAGGHVYFSNKTHDGGNHKVELDVDDMDWAGPETITITDAKPGTYFYWVYDYSGSDAKIGASEVLVRVVFNDTVAGEFAIPTAVTERQWLPFKQLVVDNLGAPSIVRFSPDEIKAGEDRKLPQGAEFPSGSATDEGTSGSEAGCERGVGIFVAVVVAVILLAAFSSSRKKRG